MATWGSRQMVASTTSGEIILSPVVELVLPYVINIPDAHEHIRGGFFTIQILPICRQEPLVITRVVAQSSGEKLLLKYFMFLYNVKASQLLEYDFPEKIA